MGITTPKLISGIIAGETLASKFVAVKLDTNGAAVAAGAGEKAIGFVQNDPENGSFAEIATIGGGAFAIAAASINEGDELKVAANGKLTPVTADGDFVVARAIEAAAANDQFHVIVTQYTHNV